MNRKWSTGHLVRRVRQRAVAPTATFTRQNGRFVVKAVVRGEKFIARAISHGSWDIGERESFLIPISTKKNAAHHVSPVTRKNRDPAGRGHTRTGGHLVMMPLRHTHHVSLPAGMQTALTIMENRVGARTSTHGHDPTIHGPTRD